LSTTNSVAAAAVECLAEADTATKVARVTQMAQRWAAGELELDSNAPIHPVDQPGRPPRPLLVNPKDVPRRKITGVHGHAAFIHAVVHIEFNAINLACDAVQRFRDMPREYYGDWIRVAKEESEHFCLLNDYLRELGYAYGDFEAHDGLWEMAVSTADDALTRMALVPRVLEARGLDVTPGMIARLQQANFPRAVEILEIIYRDEVGHVEIGSRWFNYLCAQQGRDPEPTFLHLLETHAAAKLCPPFNREARSRAGFSEGELDYLAQRIGWREKL